MRKLAGLTVLAVLATGCVGNGGSAAGAPPGQPVTITFWHGWSQAHEVKAINDNLARFKELRPEITVKAVPNIADEKIIQGIRSGNGPDVVSSFTTDYVGQFCSTGAWADLAPFIATSQVDLAKIFPAPLLEYTQFKGRRCALPLLADAKGLYYNKEAFAEAGLSEPPKTLGQLKEYALKLTRRGPDGKIERLGFNPHFGAYEHTAPNLIGTWDPAWFDPQGKSNLSRDPAVKEFFTWHTEFMQAMGGYGELDKYTKAMPDEWSPQNAFQTGKLAMMLDGEWRIANMINDKIKIPYGTAPFPVPDHKADTYGGGLLSGTIIGISRTSKQQNAAWELLKFLTTDTQALAEFAQAIYNVPSTFESLKAFKGDEHLKPFIDMLSSAHSTASPASVNGGAYVATFEEFAGKQQAGKILDLTAGLATLDKQIDADTAQAKPR